MKFTAPEGGTANRAYTRAPGRKPRCAGLTQKRKAPPSVVTLTGPSYVP